jgi:hypothetical protein
LATVLAHEDALSGFRAQRKRPFDLRLGFVVQAANAHTLIDFGELAASRRVGIRLLPLSTEGNAHLDFYRDPDEVARVVEHLDCFASWARVVEPGFLEEIGTTRAAILGRSGEGRPSLLGRIRSFLSSAGGRGNGPTVSVSAVWSGRR